jgi:hypothetical protein
MMATACDKLFFAKDLSPTEELIDELCDLCEEYQSQ